MLATINNNGLRQQLFAQEEPNTQDLDGFLASVERRAYRLALFAVKHEDDALDVVQDSMLKFASRYADKPGNEWPMLFHRIVQNTIKDHFRRQNVRNRWSTVLDYLTPSREDGDGEADPFAQVADENVADGEQHLASQQSLQQVESVLEKLPLRQQQAFLLRSWEGLNTRETAEAMNCSEGSVKTHYFRALATMKSALQDY